MKLNPAPPNSGVRFRRMDLRERPVIMAHHNQVVDTFLATTIGYDGVVVSTVEHLMAALCGCGVDNILVELDGPEVPILDGSAEPFIEVLREGGLREQNVPRKCLVIERPLLVRDGDAYIKATPAKHFQVRYGIDFPHPMVGKQEFSWSFDEMTFARDIAKARTFGFLRDVQKLQSMGLAQGDLWPMPSFLMTAGSSTRTDFDTATNVSATRCWIFWGISPWPECRFEGASKSRKPGTLCIMRS